MRRYFIRATNRSTRKVGGVWLAAWLALVPLLSLSLYAPTASAVFALDPNMKATWERTDLFVAQQSVSRSWMWGPQAFTIVVEDYAGAPGGGEVPAGKRLVAYYDKSRMEVTNPAGDRTGKYFVTNGLLVKELISGKRQIGDNSFVAYLPADVPVVGDRTNNPKAPTYASLNNATSLILGQNKALDQTGQVVTTYLEHDVAPREDLAYTHYNQTLAHYDATFGHNIPAVFWNFMNSTGKVLENGKTVDGPVVDWLFSTGYAITEPYWTKAVVGGQEKDVLVQCFERRCYSYTPSNPEAFQVEMGNVGQHYYDWRYNTLPPNCNPMPVRGFGKLWADNPSVKARIGCPYSYSSEQATKIATQKFEHGRMVWVNSSIAPNYLLAYSKTIFVLFDDGSWLTFQDTWATGQPVNAGLTPPKGLYEPGHGFGVVWRNETGLQVRDRLGWAIENDEHSGDGAVQGFDGGMMVWLGPTKEILVNYRYYGRTNVWEIYPDTFVG
jgi:hypothetical protein